MAEDQPKGRRTQVLRAEPERPDVELPGENRPLIAFCRDLMDVLAPPKKIFSRGGHVVELIADTKEGQKLELVRPAHAQSMFERYARLVERNKQGQIVERPIGSELANAALSSLEARTLLPIIDSVIAQPFLAEVNGAPVLLKPGYDEVLRVFITGTVQPENIATLKQAVAGILEILHEYRFQTLADKSRAVAALLMPTFKIGGFVKGHFPTPIFEADQSQSGKTLLAQTVAAMHGERSRLIGQKRGGTGSFDEAFSDALLKAYPFITVDNWRGTLDSPLVESVLTATGTNALRVPYRGYLDADLGRLCLSITSNRLTAPQDLLNRSLIIRICKQAGHVFTRFDEGSLPDHVRANHRFFAGCANRIVIEWHREGRPRTNERRHSFTEAIQSLDWVCQKLFMLLGIMDGHDAIAQRTVEPALESLKPQTQCDQVKFGSPPNPSRFARILRSEARERGAGRHGGG